MPRPLNQFHYSLEHGELLRSLATMDRLLIIQDLDGVCMGLVRDPRRRSMDPEYIRACRQLEGRFFVLTNGEHIGSRGVNAIVDDAFGEEPEGWAANEGVYLPGLAAGGVQLQDRFGRVSHPGVSGRELAFLDSVPGLMVETLRTALMGPPFGLAPEQVEGLLEVIVLDNAVSPTLNIGALRERFADSPQRFRDAQAMAQQLMQQLLARARDAGLGESFFVHLAPNLGSRDGREQLKPATDTDMGTTDFQFMLRGAIKEVGVLVLLNQYFFVETGEYPLGAEFNARSAPQARPELLALAQRHFDPALMPGIVGVGDTVTSSPPVESGAAWSRGGSDRGFLTLVQELGDFSASDNAVLFVDSSGGELDRPGVNPPPAPGADRVPLSALAGITDPGDPLKLNVIFPGGHLQYSEMMIALARLWRERDTA